MNTFTDTRIVWTQRSKAHRKEKGYSRTYLEALVANPERVEQIEPWKYVLYGYGYGVLLVKDRHHAGWLIKACFTDD